MSAAKAESPPKGKAFPVWAVGGAAVKLRGLKSRADLNAKKASIIQLCASGRVAIKTEDGNCIRVRPHNLEPDEVSPPVEEDVASAVDDVPVDLTPPVVAAAEDAPTPVPVNEEPQETPMEEQAREEPHESTPSCYSATPTSADSSYRALVNTAIDHACTTFTGTLMTIATLSGALVGLVETRLLTTKA